MRTSIRLRAITLIALTYGTLGAIDIGSALDSAGISDPTSDQSLTGLLQGDAFDSGDYGEALSDLLGDQANKFLSFPLKFQCQEAEQSIDPLDICDFGPDHDFELNLGVCTVSGDDSFILDALKNACSGLIDSTVSETKNFLGYEIMNSYVDMPDAVAKKGEDWVNDRLPNGRTVIETMGKKLSPLRPQNALSKDSPLRKPMMENDYQTYSVMKRCIMSKKWSSKEEAYRECSTVSIVSSTELARMSESERIAARSPLNYEKQKRSELFALGKKEPDILGMAKSGAYKANQESLIVRQKMQTMGSSAQMQQAATASDMANMNNIYGKKRDGSFDTDSDYYKQYKRIEHFNKTLMGLEETANEKPRLMLPSQEALDRIPPEKRAKYVYLYNKQKAQDIVNGYRYKKKIELQKRLLALSAAKAVADSKQYYPAIAKKRVEELLQSVNGSGGGSSGLANSVGGLL